MRKKTDKEFSKDLEYFGPYAHALHSAINSEWRRQDEDQITNGRKMYDQVKIMKGLDTDRSNGLGFFGGTFLVYRGTNLYPEHYDEWMN